MRFNRARHGTGPRRPGLAAAGGLCAAALLAGCAASASAVGPRHGDASACTAYAYRAIQSHTRVTGRPADCAGLTPEQVSRAAATAIRRAAETGPGGSARTAGKTALRRRAAEAATWVAGLITQPPAATRPPSGVAPAGSGDSGGDSGGGRLGGVSEFAVGIAALLAWLATAASGAYVLLRWLLAGGRLRAMRTATGHAGFALAGLVLWALFIGTGWAPLAWACLILLLPVAGLGMSVLLTGSGGKNPPWAVIAAHGIAAATLILLVLTATVAVA